MNERIHIIDVVGVSKMEFMEKEEHPNFVSENIVNVSNFANLSNTVWHVLVRGFGLNYRRVTIRCSLDTRAVYTGSAADSTAIAVPHGFSFDDAALGALRSV